MAGMLLRSQALKSRRWLNYSLDAGGIDSLVVQHLSEYEGGGGGGHSPSLAPFF